MKVEKKTAEKCTVKIAVKAEAEDRRYLDP